MSSAVKTRLSLAQRKPVNTDLNLAADDMMRWTIQSRWGDCIKYRKY